MAVNRQSDSIESTTTPGDLQTIPDIIIIRGEDVENPNIGTVFNDTEPLTFIFTKIIEGFTLEDIRTEDQFDLFTLGVGFPGSAIEIPEGSSLIVSGTTEYGRAILRLPVDIKGNVRVVIIRNSVQDENGVRGPLRDRSIEVPFDTLLPRAYLSYVSTPTKAIIRIRWTHDVTWNRTDSMDPMSPFILPMITWDDENSKTGESGELTEVFPNKIWTITYTYPENSEGTLRFTLPKKLATRLYGSDIDDPPERLGDPNDKSIEIEYNTISVDETMEPATVTISKPSVSIYRQPKWTTEINWSEEVTGFNNIISGEALDEDNNIIVTISGGGGSGATATAITENGTITEITVDSAGFSYTSEPTITITGGIVGARATATINDFGGVSEITVVDGGRIKVNDIEVRVIMGSGEVTPGELMASVNDPLDPKKYSFSMDLSGSGTVEVKIPALAADANGVLSPAEDVVATWGFNIEDPSIQPTVNSSNLNNVTVLCEETHSFRNNPDLNYVNGVPVRGGAYIGVSDLIVHGNTGYCVVQIQKRREANKLSKSDQSAAVLKWFAIDGSNCGNVRRYPFITQAPRGPCIYKNKVYYFEGSHYIYVFPPDAPDDIYKDEIGYIIEVLNRRRNKRILSWRSAFATSDDDRYDGVHGGTASPLVATNDALLVLSGRGRLDIAGLKQKTVGESNYSGPISTDLLNYHLVSWSKKWNQRVDLLKTNGKTGWTVLEELARQTNNFIGFENLKFIFKSNNPTKGRITGGSVIIDATDLLIDETNRNFPPSYLRSNRVYIAIGNEILSYESVSIDTESTNLVNLERGLNGTVAAEHKDNSIVVVVDRLLNADHMAAPINDLNMESDESNLYNKVVLTYARNDPRLRHINEEKVTVTNDDSINQYGERVLNLNIDLDLHQGRIAERLALEYLNRYGDLQYLITLELKAVFHYQLGDIVAIREPVIKNINRIGRIVRIGQDYLNKTTSITVRTITI